MAKDILRPCLYCGNEIPRNRRTYCSIPCQVWSRTIILGENDCWMWTGATSEGYGSIKSGGRNGKCLKTHRLAWEIFHGREMDPSKLACHECDVRSCNNPHHIFEGTYKDNTQDMMKKGRNRTRPIPGEENAASKLSDPDILSILLDDRPQRTIAKEYGVSQAAISAIKRKRTWKHIDGEVCGDPSNPTRKAFHRSHLSVLTEEDVRTMRHDSRPLRTIATQYGVSREVVRRIKLRQTWKHVV